MNAAKKPGKLLIILLTVGVVVADQLSKWMVRRQIDRHEVINVVGSYFSLMRVENTGAFLSLGDALSGVLRILILSVLPLAILGYVMYYVFSGKVQSRTIIIALCLVTGGGIGNIIDRIAYGSVTDFFYIEFSFFRTGVFNVADMAVTSGAIILLLHALFAKKDPSLTT